MATSGSTDYSVTRSDIITEALEIIGVYQAGETISASDTVSCARTLEMMIKAWQADGIGLWKDKEITLFQSYEGYSYTLGPTGSHCTASYVKTEIATAAVSGAGTITVDDDDGMSDGDYIGIELDDNSLQWTTINGAPVANVVTLTASLTDSAAVDNHVYTYTTKISRPLNILEARLHRADGTEIPLEIISREEYMALPNKTYSGTPNQVFCDKATGNAGFYVWPACDDVQELIMMTSRSPIEDFDSTANNPDFPQEWYLALVYNLAVLVGPKFGAVIQPEVSAMAYDLKDRASGFDQENTSVFFSVGR